MHPDLCESFRKLNLELVPAGYLSSLVIEPTIRERIRDAQLSSSMIQKVKQGIEALVPKYGCFSVHSDGTVMFEDRAVVPKEGDLREVIMKEAHDSKISIHPGSTKMYQDLKQSFWWTRMKRDVARFVSQCDVWKRVKTQHQKPAGLLQPLEVPEWKWDHIEMDFVTGFLRSQKGNNAVFVVIDNLSKVAHFVAVKDSISVAQLADLYTARVVSLHGITKKISSDRGSLFTSKFWQAFQKAIGTTVVFSTAYHPQTSGQVERVNQILEDMLRACVISFDIKWEECLPYA